jgi:hypothetical protein
LGKPGIVSHVLVLSEVRARPYNQVLDVIGTKHHNSEFGCRDPRISIRRTDESAAGHFSSVAGVHIPQTEVDCTFNLGFDVSNSHVFR